ncbi:VWA domain-containing protein [Sinimarinibacterium sp. CAU 1509]|uniref:vWA domain-containing protein n=1 Tax=Sinimarinibacterium sp. CAU 1509 TaxID=2562283 RepID=UPI0010AD4D13|nr:VWA domain-containing protein [Sinimarinibacterium sp. CAU 1509]
MQMSYAALVAVLVVACAQTPAEREARNVVEEDVATAAAAPAPAEMTDAMAEVGAAAVQSLRAAPTLMLSKQQVGGFAPAYAAMPSQDRETYAHFDDAGVLLAAEHPVSTFSIDVDTGAYANLRRMLREGRLPPQDAVRVEELINYFEYDYAPPSDRATPFAVHTQLAPTPWNRDTRLLRIGVQGWKPSGALPPANLVFLVDVSGSMQSPDKLALAKSALKLLTQQLDARDRISLVVYAGASGVVLPPTPGNRKAEIIAAIDQLEAGGSTNGAAGIETAYALAQQAHIDGGINRVLLATDGDFNVGTVNFEQLKDLAERKRATGVALSTLGFGGGNYNDQLMEQLADAGNGNYSYIDSLEEARRALVHSRAAMLQTIAQDVKIQIEFNPAVVAEYRLIGYENRALAREDFNNDKVDAGEIGAGHSVTALYEIALVGSAGTQVDPLRYGATPGTEAVSDELAFLRLRYKRPGEDRSQLIERPLRLRDQLAGVDRTDADFRFAAAVAGFGQLLRGGRYTESFGYDDVLALARNARGSDDQGWRGEFLQLVQLAASLDATTVKPGSAIGCESDDCG